MTVSQGRAVVTLGAVVVMTVLVVTVASRQLAATGVVRTEGALSSVAALSRAEAWAVGSTPGSLDQQHRALIERWDGSSWTIEPTPALPNSMLNDVAAVAADDVWAVGTIGHHGLVVHWDGMHWRRLEVPGLVDQVGGLLGVGFRSAEDVWAVGYLGFADYATDRHPLIEHWDGETWQRADLSGTTEGPGGALSAVAATPDGQAWAVGSTGPEGTARSTLVEHWDGRRWSRVPSPDIRGSSSILAAVTVAATDDVWAVGSSAKPGFGPLDVTLLEHWDGTAWSVVPSPGPSLYGGSLGSVQSVSPNDVWAVGSVTTSDGSGSGITDGGGATSATLAEHWDGDSWAVVDSPDLGRARQALADLSIVSPNDIWAVGGVADPDGAIYPVVLRWDGRGWSVVEGAG